MNDRIKEFEKKYNKNLILMCFYAMLILVFSVIVTYIFKNLFIGFSVIVVGIFVVMNMTKSKKENLKAEFKDIVVVEGLKKRFIDFKYDHEQGFDEEFIANLNLFDDWKLFSSNNYFSSVYNNVKFYMSNISIKGIDKNVYENTYDSFFLGQWYTFNFEQYFKHSFIASTKSLAINLKCFKNNKFKTENIEFDNIFYISNIQNNDHFIIPDSQILTKLINIKNTLGCEMMFVFDGSRLHIGVCSRMNFFETRKFMGLNIKKEFEDLSKELDTLTYLIDEFSKDDLLFK